jgi:general secretion pathway protein D
VLVITDYSSAIRDMVTMTKELDRPASGEGIYTIGVKYADAVALAQKLGEILGTGQGGPGMARAGRQGRHRQGRDRRGGAVEAPGRRADQHDHPAWPARPATSGSAAWSSASTSRPAALAPSPARSTSTASRTPTPRRWPRRSTRRCRGAEREHRSPRRTTGPTRPGNDIVNVSGGSSFEGQVRITHDAPTNALVVLSSGRDFEALKGVVRELDVPRRQVFIEAVILELNVGSGLDLGTSFHGGLPLGSDEDSLLFGGVQSSDLKSLQLSTRWPRPPASSAA